ncbi:histidine phosphatase family protein, partial [Nonomuraea fuscirosea]
PGGRVLVVAHTTAIRLTLCRLIGVPLGEYRRLFPRLDNCALTELRLRAGRVALLQYNSPIGAVR